MRSLKMDLFLCNESFWLMTRDRTYGSFLLTRFQAQWPPTYYEDPEISKSHLKDLLSNRLHQVSPQGYPRLFSSRKRIESHQETQVEPFSCQDAHIL